MWSPLSTRMLSGTSGIVTPPSPGITTSLLFLSSKLTNLPPLGHLLTNLSRKSLAKSKPRPKASTALISVGFISWSFLAEDSYIAKRISVTSGVEKLVLTREKVRRECLWCVCTGDVRWGRGFNGVFWWWGENEMKLKRKVLTFPDHPLSLPASCSFDWYFETIDTLGN